MLNSLAGRFSLQQGEELSQEYQVIKYGEAPEQPQAQDNKQWHGNTAYLNTFSCHLHEVLPQAIYNTWCDKQTAAHFHLLYALCYLASYENKDEGVELGEVLYGAEKIATGNVVPGFKLSRKTFDAKINDLEAWGLLKVTRGKKRKGRQGNLPNRIKLNFKPYSSK